MSHCIVHWQEIVGSDFMSTFLSVESGRKASEQEIEKHRLVRWKMRRCGYGPKDGAPFDTEYGWFGKVKYGMGDKPWFHTTAPEGRQYISTQEWLEYLHRTQQDRDEAEYYGNVTKSVAQVVSGVTQAVTPVKPRRDIDDVFTDEAEVPE